MTLRVGILGPGGIAARHATAVAALPDTMSLVGVCGRDQPRAAAFAAEHGGTAFTDLDAMIDAGLDLLIVALPPFAHDGEITHAASRGINVLVEKPIALEMAQAEAMVAACAPVTAAVGFMYRHGDAVRRWQASDTGRVGMMTGSYHCNALHTPWWRTRAKSGGQIVEQVIHLIDLVQHVMGQPDTVYARRANLFHRATPEYDVEDVSSIVFGWDDGRIATLAASNIAVPGRWTKRWSIFAEHLSGQFTGWNDAVLTTTGAEPRDEIVAGDTNPFVAQLADLAAAIAERRAPLAPIATGASALRMALAAARSANERREVRIADEV